MMRAGDLERESRPPHNMTSASWLWGLTLLFLVRVVAQPLSLVATWPWLPTFTSWQSGVLPYSLLLASQLTILIVMVLGARQVSAARAVFGSAAGRALVGFGAIYFAFMALRLALGISVLRDHVWFGRPIPAAFHLVLAGYVLVYGRFQLRHASRS